MCIADHTEVSQVYVMFAHYVLAREAIRTADVPEAALDRFACSVPAFEKLGNGSCPGPIMNPSHSFSL